MPRLRPVFLLTAALILTLDRLTKVWVLNNIDLYEAWHPFPKLAPFFSLFHTTNTGAAFGLFRNANPFFIVIAAISVVAIFIYTHRYEQPSRLVCVALGMLFAGAGGNLWDRLVHGHVIDFIDFRYSDTLGFPTFNIADSSLTVGVVLLAFYFYQQDRAERRGAASVSAGSRDAA